MLRFRRSHRRRKTRSLVPFLVCLPATMFAQSVPASSPQKLSLTLNDIYFCLAVAAAIGLVVLALALWRQLHAVEHPHLTSIVGR